MRNHSLLQLIGPAVLLALLIAAVPSGSISAQRCVDGRGNPIACPEEQKKRPTVVYPSFTPTVTLTPIPTATKVPTKTSTVVPSATTITPKVPTAAGIPGRPGDFLWPAGVLLGLFIVLAAGWLLAIQGNSKFTAEAYGDLNADSAHSTLELEGSIDEDDSVRGSAGMYSDKEDE
jgi:hypothetical protein